MHIDADYQISLMVIEKQSSNLFSLDIKEALELIKSRELDLILSEPQNMALFDKAVPSTHLSLPALRNRNG
jgi:hypothetical protein